MGAIKEFGVNLVANVSGFKQSMTQAAASSKKFKADLDATFGGIAKIGAPLGALAVNAVRASISFEEAFAGVRKTVQDASEKDFEDLRKSILQMSTELPASANQIAKVAENAAQLGVAKEDILGFTKTLIDLSESTNITAEEGSIALAQFANAVKMPLADIDKLGSVIVGLGNTMATTEAHILEFATRISGTGKTVGLSASEIIGFSASLSSVGLEAEAGASAFNKVMKDIQSAVSLGGNSLKQFATIAGVSIEEFSRKFKESPKDAILAFLNGLAEIKANGGDLVVVLEKLGMTETRLSDTILRSVTGIDGFNTALKEQQNLWDSNTALTDEANKRYETTGSKLKIAYNEMNKLSIEIGDKATPALRDMLLVIRDAIVDLDAFGGAITDFLADTIVKFQLFKQEQAKFLDSNPVEVYSQDWANNFGKIADSANKAFSKLDADPAIKEVGTLGVSVLKGVDQLKAFSKQTTEVATEQKKTSKTTRDISNLTGELTDKTKELEQAQKKAAEEAKKLREEQEEQSLSAYQAVAASEKYKVILEDVKKGLLSQKEGHRLAGDMTMEYRVATEQLAIAQEKLEDVITDVALGLQDPTAVNNAIANFERFKKKQEEILEAPKSKKGGFWSSLFGDFDISAIGKVKEGALNELGKNISASIGNAIMDVVSGSFNRQSFSGLLESAGGAAGAAFGIPFADKLAAPIAQSLANIGQSTASTVKGVITAFTGVGALIPDSVFTGMFGDSAATAARKAADKFFADAFDKNRLSLVINGQLQQITDLQFSGNQDGSGIFGQLSEDARTAFEGVGMAAEMALGIATDMGVNLGNVFANNVGGSLNNLQLLLQSVGLTAEQMKGGIVQAFKAADMSATEAFKALQNVEQITQKGIPGAAGAAEDAFQNLIDSAGTGIALIDALGDVGAEGLERGAKGLEGLKQELIASGRFSREEVEKLFNAIGQSGITTLEELRDVSDETAIAIAANLEGAGFGFGPLKEDLKDISNTLKEIPKSKDVQVNIRANISPQDREAIALVTDGQIGGSSPIATGGFTETQEIQGRSSGISSFAKSATKKASAELVSNVKEQIRPTLETVKKDNEEAAEKVKVTWWKKFGDIFGNKRISKAFSEIAGEITKESSKIAQAIAGKVNKSLAEMQLLLHETGVSVSQLGDKIVDDFLKKTLSATEAASALKELGMLEQVGDPTKQGAIGEALERLKTQGGKGGFEALNAIKGVIQEASEVLDAKKEVLDSQIEGIKDKADLESRGLSDEEKATVDKLQAQLEALNTLEALRTEMIATGKATENDINAVYIAMKDAGLDSIKQLADATERDLIPVLARLQELSFFKMEIPEVEVVYMDEEGNMSDKKKGSKKKGKKQNKIGGVLDSLKKFGSKNIAGARGVNTGSIVDNESDGIMSGRGNSNSGLFTNIARGGSADSITINVNASDITLARKVADAVREQLDSRNRAPGRAF